MVIVTERAKEHLKDTILPQLEEQGATARLAQTSPGQLGLVPDTEKAGDQVVEHDGTTVLLIDEELSGQLSGAEIDCVDADAGARLTIRRPEAGA